VWSLLLFVAGVLDNVLKPLMIGRGVDVPMAVILLDSLGGMASGGIVGMFVGATALALGYQLFMGWVAVRRGPAISHDEPGTAGRAPRRRRWHGVTNDGSRSPDRSGVESAGRQ
jgi:predicted PurR-regulated permease PerM